MLEGACCNVDPLSHCVHVQICIVWYVSSFSSFSSIHHYAGRYRSDYVGPMSLWNGRAYSFVQVHGKERQTLNGSFQNLPEANTVVDLVQRLQQQASHDRIPQWNSPDHIRIVTFYQAQVSLIQRLLHKQRLGGAIVVATVDSSQGCESDVVIVSFVRSPHSHTKNNNRSGKAPTVGFLADDRRMNVAITRGAYERNANGNARFGVLHISNPCSSFLFCLVGWLLFSLSFQQNINWFVLEMQKVWHDLATQKQRQYNL